MHHCVLWEVPIVTAGPNSEAATTSPELALGAKANQL
jgi:hypothetical protein